MLASHHERKKRLHDGTSHHKRYEFLSNLKARRKASKQLECKVTHLIKQLDQRGKSSVPKLLAGFCLLTAPSPSMLLDPSPWHRSSNEQYFDLFLLSEQNKSHNKMHYCILIHASLFSITPVSKQSLNTC